MRQRLFHLFSLLALLSSSNTQAQQIKTLTEDGAWCWFSDPRAIYKNSKKNEIITGWVTKSGDIIASSFNSQTGKSEQKLLYKELEIDDHDNPAFLELSNGSILTQYTWHGGNKTRMGVIQHHTDQTGQITSFSDPWVFMPETEELVKKYVRQTYTYANPFSLKKEDNKLYSFGRWIGYKPNLITSTDQGKTWSDPQVVITSKDLNINNRPYVKYYSDGISKIHLIFTDGHPNAEPLNSVYYCYYENNAFWRADGSKICDIDKLPFHPSDATVVYQATSQTGKAWIFDIVIDKKGRPVVAYTRYPTNLEHLYHYAVYDKGQWVDHQIINSGKWFPQTQPNTKEREENYSGGITIDPTNPEVLYFSHQIDNRFELSKGTTKDLGKTWKIEPITRNSTYDNVRPFIPRYKKKTDKTVLLWMQNKEYIHYTKYSTSILYKVIK